MLRAQPPLHRTGADFHRSADTASDTVEKRKAEGLYLFGMWGTGVAPAVTFCQHGCTSDQAGRGFGHSIGKSGSGRRLLRWLRRLFVRLTGCHPDAQERTGHLRGGYRPIVAGSIGCPQQPMPLLRCRRKRSEEHTSELQSLMRLSYAVFCLKKKKINYH